jgi:hypothetical protein
MEFANATITLLSAKDYKSIYANTSVSVADFWVLPLIKTTFVNRTFGLNWSIGIVKYKLTLFPAAIKSYEYIGTVICDGDESGKINMTFFESLNSVLLKGTWNAIECNYDCIIELKK